MRLALALPLVLLITAAVSAPAAAQQAQPTQPSQSKPSQPKQSQTKPGQAKPGQPAPTPAAAQPAPEAPKLSPEEERLRQRILLQERFNKGWQIEPEDPRQTRARCRSEARKRFSAMHPLKRRKFQKECIAEAKAAPRPR